jgi:hypothetical protein
MAAVCARRRSDSWRFTRLRRAMAWQAETPYKLRAPSQLLGRGLLFRVGVKDRVPFAVLHLPD